MPDEPHELDADYLRDLAERLYRIPVVYGVDSADYDRLRRIASRIEPTHMKDED